MPTIMQVLSQRIDNMTGSVVLEQYPRVTDVRM